MSRRQRHAHGRGRPKRTLLDRLRSLFGRRPPRTCADDLPEPPPWEPALVPRRPRPSGLSGGVALELPPERIDLDLRGFEA